VKTRVLDSWAILEWIAGRQPACGMVAALLSEAETNRAKLWMSVINAGEVYYCLRKNHNVDLAESWRESSPTMPITFEAPTAAEIWTAAAIKAEFPIPYADAFAAALSRKYTCPLMTGDPEFRIVDRLELDWIGGPAK
jgi:uncharacterized protein